MYGAITIRGFMSERCCIRDTWLYSEPGCFVKEGRNILKIEHNYSIKISSISRRA